MNKSTLVAAVFCISTSAFSQVGINTNSPKTTLDIKASSNATLAEGLLTVRLTGDELKSKDGNYGVDQNSTLVYVTSLPTTTSPKTVNITTPGFYYYNSASQRWINFNVPKFFYMPSVLITPSTPQPVDLYSLYKNQFTNPMVKSAGATNSKIPILNSGDLEYYINYVDTTVYSNLVITNDGKLTFTANQNSSDVTFMNIIFVVK